MTRCSLPLQPYRKWLLLALTGFTIHAAAQVNPTITIDKLTQQWLDTDRQTSHLQSDWQTQKPVLEQRLALLKEEKKQLQSILKNSNAGQDDVKVRRSELLKEQSELELQQQTLSQALDLLVSRVEVISNRLPPPLKNTWQQEYAALGEEPEASLQLQIALTQLSQLADFDQRVVVHEMPITLTAGDEVLVKQLYLGAGFAWFSSTDGHYAGWGNATDTGWQWQLDQTADANEIIKAIAIFEKRQQASFVRLPIHLNKILESAHE